MDFDKNLSPLIVGFGYPCLDYVVKVNETDLLDKFNLKYDNQCNVSHETSQAIIEEAKKKGYHGKYYAGGCAQNTLRIFQWLVNEPYKTVSFGAVGNDQEAIELKSQVQNDGVVTKYDVIPNYKTTCIIIISYKSYRSAAGNIESYKTYSQYKLSDEYLRIIDKTTIIHLDSFFVFCCPEISQKIVQKYSAEKIISFNLGAKFLLEVQPENIVKLCEQCDILIGNRIEFETLFSYLGLKINNDDFVETLKSCLKIFKPECKDYNNKRLSNEWEKIIVVTDAQNPVHCIYGQENILIHNVPILKDVSIVDTTGAGDAFIAGFLYGILYYTNDIAKSIDVGCRAAREIIQQIAVTIPKNVLSLS